MKAAVKIGAIVLAGLGLLTLPLAWRHRHQLRQIAHRIVHGGGSSVHSGPPVINHVIFNGRVFSDVLGYPPFYLDVPQLNSVLFITRVNDGGSNEIHIFNPQSGQDIVIPTIADFGRSIGLTNGAFLEYVDRVDQGTISVASEYGAGRPMKIVYHLNLRTAKMDDRDIYYFDRHGNITDLIHAPGF